jgi:opacity protein-like surface antigen
LASENNNPSQLNAITGVAVSQKLSANKADSLTVIQENQEEILASKANTKDKEEKPKEVVKSGSLFAIKLAIAPDYSTVKRATPNSMGINYGALLEFRISKHWSVATGGIWSKKIYTAKDVEYNGHHADWVDGDCRMWDIPVNVYYHFTSSRSFSFYTSAGFSSYLMNEENYVFYYDTPKGVYDYPKQIKGENKEWFKTLNVSAGVQWRINTNFSFQFEPTLKAPLAGVGVGEVSLVSLGAFINLKYDIPFKKSDGNDKIK